MVDVREKPVIYLPDGSAVAIGSPFGFARLARDISQDQNANR